MALFLVHFAVSFQRRSGTISKWFFMNTKSLSALKPQFSARRRKGLPLPIRKELRHFYTGPHWKEVRARILQRANNQCEQCGKPNRRHVWVGKTSGEPQFWTLRKLSRHWISCATAQPFFYPIRPSVLWRSLAPRRIRVILTIAHLNHIPGDDRAENLKALCQWCHLNYDKFHHKESRSIRKDRERPILKAIEGAAIQV